VSAEPRRIRPNAADVKAAVARAQVTYAQLRIGGAPPEEATAWFRTAARQGDARAINMLGRACELGWGMRADLKAAAKHYARAAALGDAWAMFNLADLTLNGRGVPADEGQAYALYEQAGSLGHAKALNMMGLLRETGRGAERDDALALDLFRAAAEGGDCWGAFNLARRLADDGVMDEALVWIERAIEAGFPDFWRTAAALLATHPDTRARALGRLALARAATPDEAGRRPST
jgi:TPR repeat protein